jgi:signal transduction histidine kinase
VPEKPLMIVVDKDKLKQACVNVVQNAIEAMPDGGELEVGIDISFHNGVHFFIKDSGVGLKEDSKSRLFDLFFTTKGMGTGLGLGNVRKIIEAHGGSVAINSTQPKGATVSIYLPSGVLNSQT